MRKIACGAFAALIAVALTGFFGFLFGWGMGDHGHQIEAGWRAAAIAEGLFGWGIGLLAFGVGADVVRP